MKVQAIVGDSNWQHIAEQRLAALWLVFAPLFLLTALPAHAQLPVPAPTPILNTPGAGLILQQAQPVFPQAPARSGTGPRVDRSDGSSLPASAAFLVQSLTITGNTLFETPTLLALMAGVLGQSVTLPQLGEQVALITAFYRTQGYLLSRAVIPAQEIRNGAVRIEVIEARYGKISLDNRSRVNNTLLEATLAPLQSGQAIGQAGLDQALLLLSDIPGIVVASTLKPGDTVGTSDLSVSTLPGPAAPGSVVLDNYGNRYTGRARIGATLNLLNPLNHSDILTASGLSSGSGMNYGRIAYEALLNGRGTRVGGAYSALRYSLGAPLAALNAYGTARVQSLWAKQPLLRSRDVNVYGQIQYDELQLRDHVDAGAIRTDRQLGSWTLSLSGDARDALLTGGVSSWSLVWTAGRVGFDNAAAQLADTAAARTQGSFSKLNASLARLQTLDPNNGLYLALSGQRANTNLDSSQKLSAGGPYSVRAYDTGAISGDSGVLASVEWRHSLGVDSGGQWQTVTFIDSARVAVNKNTWAAGANSATLSGVGFGLNWSGADLWSARAYVAKPIGTPPALVAANVSARAWVEIRRWF